jgi:hypothetical protein
MELAAETCEPREYVVPPTVRHCFPTAVHGAACGVLSYWLEGVTSVADAAKDGWFRGQHDHLLDPKLFASDRRYRDSIARVNVLTYVIGHRDSHARNFVLARTGKRTPFVYSIDNSLSFTMAPNPRIPPTKDWSKLHVPALPRTVIERLRSASDKLSSLEAAGLTSAEIDGVRARMADLVRRADRGELQLY